MRRKLLNIATYCSLALCVCVCVLWVRSYWAKDWFEWVQAARPADERPQRVRSLWSGRGVAGGIVSHFTARPVERQPWRLVWESEAIGNWRRPGGSVPRWLGFGHQSVDDPEQGYRELFVPHWFVAVLLATLPAAQFAGARRLRRRPCDSKRGGADQHPRGAFAVRVGPADRCGASSQPPARPLIGPT